VVAVLAGLFFVVAVVLMASAPWVLLQPDQQTRTELNRWFLTVAGSVDAITAGVLLALAQQPRRTLLVVELVGAVVVAGAIILPFQPSFAAILAVGVVPLIVYPYWRDVRTFPSWWAGMSHALLIFAALAGAALLVTAAMAFPRQIGGTDEAARGGWWLDYAEHATVLALAGVLATSRGPGCRILRGLCSAVWLYLGLVAALVLPHHPGSWGRIGGAVAFLVGICFGLATWRGPEREVTGTRAVPCHETRETQPFVVVIHAVKLRERCRCSDSRASSP
jgi:hypothetical protein